MGLGSLHDHAMGLTRAVVAGGVEPSSDTQNLFEFVLDVIGPRAQKNLPDTLRYEPGFSVDVLADLALPVGKYDRASR